MTPTNQPTTHQAESTTQHQARETWLQAAIELLRPEFVSQANATFPEDIRVSVGFGGVRSIIEGGA